MTGLVTGLDALSDVLIASIPIIVLHRAKIRTRQKISLGVFLCLNLVMVCLAITRASKINGAAGVDVPWEFFWQFMEASVAVLMGSLTVFRTLLTSKTGAPDERRKLAGGPMAPCASCSRDGLPEVPSATMTGLWTFIQRNNCDTSTEGGTPLAGTSQ
ncbi:Integral membrane protein [Apiospora sp. TS-2023a]